MILCAIFLLFYSQGAIIVTPEEQDINLNFNATVVSSTTLATSSTDTIIGSLMTEIVEGTKTIDVLSTRSNDGKSIGSVKIVNNSNKSQSLVKTTQLQAESGLIVRIDRDVTVPAGKSVVVGVYPADNNNFTAIAPGNLTIIKLAKSLQPSIYAVAETSLAYGPSEVKVVAESDINRAKQDLVKELVENARLKLGLSDGDGTISEILEVTTDKKIGDVSEKLQMKMKVRIKYLSLDDNSLLALIEEKIKQSTFEGLNTGTFAKESLKYSILEASTQESQTIKLSYNVKAYVDSSNDLLSTHHFTSKTVDEVKEYLANSGVVKKVEISISPYWKQSFPDKASRIKVIINQ